jgi:hypothetical protein
MAQDTSSSSSSPPTLASPHPVSVLPRSANDGILPSTLQPATYRLAPNLPSPMQYHHGLQPPRDWCINRNRDLPCIFRDTLLSTWWSSEQQRAIAATFTAWDTNPKHRLLQCKGYLSPASTLLPLSAQQQPTNHLLRYYVDRLHSRTSDTHEGLIIWGVDITGITSAAPLRHGPVGLDMYRSDCHYNHNPASTHLHVVAGMKNTYTRPHVDDGGDSTWSMLLEGQKLWLFARPERKDDFRNYFSDDRVIRWYQWTTADKKFLFDNDVQMIVQRPGDMMYVPYGWVHTVKHLSNTLALNGAILHGWNLCAALSSPAFNRCNDAERTLFQQVCESACRAPGQVWMYERDVPAVRQLLQVAAAPAVAVPAEAEAEQSAAQPAEKRPRTE